ncbi:hypothetical protein A9264_12875 [Vibrio sp. UCD-FRSSP16_10]|uniref:DUF805 domain-containing protein n=1 Tax=unclassified Vibrio TaxID=2614977 RepID=UPI0007FE1FA2|nr:MULTISPECIES: DUF805 domain-containing protein [unclassified Vibrio]OBT15554.1 hypothetical protein A9260_13090 [Vibrio sp. UCD-FRSSP16_30]OBT20627.1 hypothetical protein A9264_12875 [Vibrio sp. UCD-FRSSP16_10]
MNIFSFQGRASRRTYWSMVLANIVIILIMRFSLHGNFSNHGEGDVSNIATFVVFVISVLMLWWSLAIQVKRLHDLDKAGWWVLINLIPYLGTFPLMIYLGCFKGTNGSNRFGNTLK